MTNYDYPHPDFRLDGVRLEIFSIMPSTDRKIAMGEGAVCYAVQEGSGTLSVRMGNNATPCPIQLGQGDIVVIGGFNSHELSAAGSDRRLDDQGGEPWQVVQVRVSSVEINMMLDSSPFLALRKGDEDQILGHIWRSIDAMLQEYVDASELPWRADILRRLAEVLNINITRALAQRKWVTSGAFADERIFRAIAAASNDLTRAWKLSDLAATAGMSRTAFAVRYREVLGNSPAKGLSQMRTRSAARLLHKGKDSVDAIAFQVGYKSATPFIRAFKREFGVTPAQWRKHKAVGSK